jgi:tetratricopeptide (TPR) repeat protein
MALLMLLQMAGWCRADGSYEGVLAGADAKAKGKDYTAARTQYRHALTLARGVGSRIDVQRRIAQTYLGEGDVEAVRSEYRAIMDIEGVSPDQKVQVCQWIGETYTNRDQRAGMRAEWAKALMIEGVSDGRKAEMVQRIAKSYIEDGRLEEAREEYGLLLDDEEMSSDQKATAYQWLADTYSVTQRAAARAALARGTALEGLSSARKAELFQRIAKSFLEEGRADDARSEYGLMLTAAGLGPDQRATAYQWLADTYSARQRDEARAQLRKGAALDGVSWPLKYELLSRVADMCVQDGKLADARAVLAGMLDSAEPAVDRKMGILNRIGKLYVQEGVPEEARKEYAKVHALAGVKPDQRISACQWIADTYSLYLPEQRARAREELAKGVAIEGGAVAAKIGMLQRMGKSFLEEGRLEEALAVYAKVLEITGVGVDQKAAAFVWRYEAYPFARRVEARAELGKALALEGVSVAMTADLLNRLRVAYAETGSIDEARAEAQKLLDLKDASKSLKDQAQKYLNDTK